MKKTLRLIAAASLAATGLITVAVLPASGARAHKVTCYRLVANKDKSAKFKGHCPKGWSKTKPKPKPPVANSLQGSNKSGDIDLVVPSNASLAINGSSFDAPLVGATTSGSTAYSAGGKVSFSAYPAGGSGSGRTGITNGSLNIGFTDVPMNAAAGTLPSGVTESSYVQVPYLLGGAVVGYNLGGGFDNLKLTAAEVADIYNGTITLWSDPQIVATNGGANSTLGKALTALATANQPKNTIKVLYRNASSGTTEAFTYWLYQAGSSGIAPSGGAVMEGAGGAWKATNIDGVANNSGMAQGIDNTLGSIGYVEYSYILIPGNAAIDVAQLQDKNGQWLTPSLTNIGNAAASAGTSVTPDNFAITNEPGANVWPFVTYSWAVVPKSQSSEATCEASVKYLDWETHYAQDALAKTEGYVPLPTAVRAYARAQLETVTASGTVCLNQSS
ncbi:MAG: phosphate transporter, periplasmic phosphate-binding protein [Acidimicrobiaceae bacterium]|nr:phosphate transporter, periplasmic phosphate-binding protein [Acidimicrobiaceae bacterium]